MFIASKLVDPCPIPGSDLVRYTDDTYTLTELLVSFIYTYIVCNDPEYEMDILYSAGSHVNPDLIKVISWLTQIVEFYYNSHHSYLRKISLSLSLAV